MTTTEEQLLTFLSTVAIPISLIAADLGHDNQSRITDAIKSLRGRNIPIETGNRRGGRCVWVDPDVWHIVRPHCDRAWALLEKQGATDLKGVPS
tara:strand:- start:450 stop:731 length:282 start_codon:yes stop_codon:yes gene_type:complete